MTLTACPVFSVQCPCVDKIVMLFMDKSLRNLKRSLHFWPTCLYRSFSSGFFLLVHPVETTASIVSEMTDKAETSATHVGWLRSAVALLGRP